MSDGRRAGGQAAQGQAGALVAQRPALADPRHRLRERRRVALRRPHRAPRLRRRVLCAALRHRPRDAAPALPQGASCVHPSPPLPSPSPRRVCARVWVVCPPHPPGCSQWCPPPSLAGRARVRPGRDPDGAVPLPAGAGEARPHDRAQGRDDQGDVRAAAAAARHPPPDRRQHPRQRPRLALLRRRRRRGRPLQPDGAHPRPAAAHVQGRQRWEPPPPPPPPPPLPPPSTPPPISPLPPHTPHPSPSLVLHPHPAPPPFLPPIPQATASSSTPTGTRGTGTCARAATTSRWRRSPSASTTGSSSPSARRCTCGRSSSMPSCGSSSTWRGSAA